MTWKIEEAKEDLGPKGRNSVAIKRMKVSRWLTKQPGKLAWLRLNAISLFAQALIAAIAGGTWAGVALYGSWLIPVACLTTGIAALAFVLGSAPLRPRPTSTLEIHKVHSAMGYQWLWDEPRPRARTWREVLTFRRPTTDVVPEPLNAELTSLWDKNESRKLADMMWNSSPVTWLN